MNIIFITSGSFPFGEASINRLLSYAKGMVELNHDIKVLLINPAKKQSVKSDKIEGIYNGINFCYTSQTTSWPDKTINKLVILKRGVSNALRKLRVIKSNQSIDAIIVLETNPFVIYPFLKFSKRYGIKILHERTEFPFLNHDSLFKKIQLKFYLKKVVPEFDGIYVITNSLIEYFSKYLKPETQIKLIPMTVEPDRFQLGLQKKNIKSPYIAYCGSMYNDKDGVPILIESFSYVRKKFPEYKLVLIGDNRNKGKFKSIDDVIQKHNLEDSVVLTGLVSRDEMPRLLSKASILALSRPDNIQAKGGFPTKLGEYLATGNPVVVTSVGEIPLYLTDGVNSYISKPDDSVAFADKLMEVINDYPRAEKIGLEGKKLVFEVFNYKVQAENITKFIKKL